MAQIIKRGILQSFDPTTYTASVLIIEATSAFLTGVPIATSTDGSSAQPNAFCAVLFFDEHNPTDAVIIAIYPNGSVGVPAPPPGRLLFLAPTAFFLAGITIPSGSINTYTVTGQGGVPPGAKAIIYNVTAGSSTVGAKLLIAPKGLAPNGLYDSVQTFIAAQLVALSSVLQVSALGQIDIFASGGTYTVYMSIRGYVL